MKIEKALICTIDPLTLGIAEMDQDGRFCFIMEQVKHNPKRVVWIDFA